MDQIDDIVGKLAKEGIHVSQEIVEYLLWYCNRKMDLCGIENRNEYLPVLFDDELKNYLFRQCVNVTTLLMMHKGECA